MPLFEERRLESVGLTGRAEQRVPLQAAFWLVDGGCAWVSNSTEQLKIALRVQEVGGKEQRINLTSAPDRRAEAAVLDALEKALANRSQGNADETANAESELLARRGNELATRSSPFDRGFTFYGGRGRKPPFAMARIRNVTGRTGAIFWRTINECFCSIRPISTRKSGLGRIAWR